MSLENMYIKAMKDVEEFAESPADGDSLRGVRLPEETNFAEEEIRKVLAQRKKQIEFVIDDHLAHLHGQANLKRFDELSHSQKLRYLTLNQANIDKQARVRMIDITQSYNIHDSDQFKLSKQLEDILDDNKHFNLLDQNEDIPDDA